MITLKIEDPETGRKTILKIPVGRPTTYTSSATYQNLCTLAVTEKRICPLRITVLDVGLNLDDIITALIELKVRIQKENARK